MARNRLGTGDGADDSTGNRRFTHHRQPLVYCPFRRERRIYALPADSLLSVLFPVEQIQRKLQHIMNAGNRCQSHCRINAPMLSPAGLELRTQFLVYFRCLVVIEDSTQESARSLAARYALGCYLQGRVTTTSILLVNHRASFYAPSSAASFFNRASLLIRKSR